MEYDRSSCGKLNHNSWPISLDVLTISSTAVNNGGAKKTILPQKSLLGQKLVMKKVPVHLFSNTLSQHKHSECHCKLWSLWILYSPWKAFRAIPQNFVVTYFYQEYIDSSTWSKQSNIDDPGGHLELSNSLEVCGNLLLLRILDISTRSKQSNNLK